HHARARASAIAASAGSPVQGLVPGAAIVIEHARLLVRRRSATSCERAEVAGPADASLQRPSCGRSSAPRLFEINRRATRFRHGIVLLQSEVSTRIGLSGGRHTRHASPRVDLLPKMTTAIVVSIENAPESV